MQNNLNDILTIEFPEIDHKEDSFLDIIGQGHKEKSISNIYAYFLDIDKGGEIAETLITSLQQLIEKESSLKFKLQNYKCYVEEVTKKNNRVDIIIDSETSKEVIIIENKIHHTLNNDLLDYWDYKDYPNDNKIGVILTLHPIAVPHQVKDKFINITHLDWIKKVEELGIPVGLPINQQIYLNDFINNIKHLSKNYIMNEQVKFFFKHTEKILRARELHTAAETYVNTQLEITASKVGWKLNRGGQGYKAIWDGYSEAYYTVITSDVLSPKRTVKIIIELYKDARHKHNDLKEILSTNEKYHSMNQDGYGNQYWIHFASKDYVLSDENIENLGNYLHERIVEDFAPVMSPILNNLKQ